MRRRGAGRDLDRTGEIIGLIILARRRSRGFEAGVDLFVRARHHGGGPVAVGEAEPAAGRLHRLDAVGLLVDGGVGVALLGAVGVAGHAFEHRKAARLRRAAAQDQRIGVQRHRLVGLVVDLVGDGEHVFVVDGDLAREHEAGAVVVGQRHRMARRQIAAGGRPARLPRRRLERFVVADEAGLGPIGIGGAGGREQHDVRALRVDGLAVGFQIEVVERGAVEIDRAADAGGVERDARMRGEGVGARTGSLPPSDGGARRRGGIDAPRGDRRRRVERRPRLRREEIVPTDQDDRRQDDRQDQVAGLLGVHQRPSRRRLARASAPTMSATSVSKPIDSASRRAIST